MSRYYLPHPEYLRCLAKADVVVDTLAKLRSMRSKPRQICFCTPTAPSRTTSMILQRFGKGGARYDIERGEVIPRLSLSNSKQDKLTAFGLLTWACSEKKLPVSSTHCGSMHIRIRRGKLSPLGGWPIDLSWRRATRMSANGSRDGCAR